MPVKIGRFPYLRVIRDGLPNFVKRYNGRISVIPRVLEKNYRTTVSSLTLEKYLKNL